LSYYTRDRIKKNLLKYNLNRKTGRKEFIFVQILPITAFTRPIGDFIAGLSGGMGNEKQRNREIKNREMRK